MKRRDTERLTEKELVGRKVRVRHAIETRGGDRAEVGTILTIDGKFGGLHVKGAGFYGRRIPHYHFELLPKEER